MTSRSNKSFARPIQTLFDSGSVGILPDDQLIERFLSDAGEAGAASFGVLVRRHGPMVHGACLCILKDRHEAEDAFQATFLVLARKAGSIRRRDSLSSWLLGVARRVAVRLKVQRTRRLSLPERLALEVRGATPSASGNNEFDEVDGLREEIGRLPSRFQMPVLLCYWEGMSYEEAARTLGVSEGSLRGRLAQARGRLRTRLARRGLAPDGALPAMVAASSRASGAARAALVESTIRSSIRGGLNRAVVAGSAFREVMQLSEGVLKAMWYSELKSIAAVTLATCLAAAGAGAVVLAKGEPAVVVQEVSRTTKPSPPQGEIGRLQGTWVRISVESGGQSRLLPEDQRNQLEIRGTNFRFTKQTPSGEEARIDPDRKPKTIDLTPRGEEAGPLQGKTYFGIYELEGDTLMLCLDIYRKSERPKEFATKLGDRLLIDLFKRVGP